MLAYFHIHSAGGTSDFHLSRKKSYRPEPNRGRDRTYEAETLEEGIMIIEHAARASFWPMTLFVMVLSDGRVDVE